MDGARQKEFGAIASQLGRGAGQGRRAHPAVHLRQRRIELVGRGLHLFEIAFRQSASRPEAGGQRLGLRVVVRVKQLVRKFS